MQALFERGCNALIDWGPGMLIAALVLYGLYRLVKSVGLKIVMALEKPASALSQQAESLDRLTRSIQEYVTRDQTDHHEIIILQKVILGEIKNLRGEEDAGA